MDTIPHEVVVLILTQSILRDGKPRWREKTSSRKQQKKLIGKGTHAIVKAKCVQLLCSYLFSLMTTCKTWTSILQTHEAGAWFNNMAYSIYSYAHPHTNLARKDWWNQCELKVRAFINIQTKTYWNSSVKTTCELSWDDIVIILPESLCAVCTIYKAPKRRPSRYRARDENGNPLYSTSVVVTIVPNKLKLGGKKRKVGTMSNGEETQDKRPSKKRKGEQVQDERPSKKLKLHKT